MQCHIKYLLYPTTSIQMEIVNLYPRWIVYRYTGLYMYEDHPSEHQYEHFTCIQNISYQTYIIISHVVYAHVFII